MAPNPYAPPTANNGSFNYPGGASQATLRGDVLVVQKNAMLPSVCMKCGTHENIRRRNAKYSWAPTWARLSLVFCTIGGAIALMLTTKRAQLALPLCGVCNSRWSTAVVAAVALVVGLVLSIFSFPVVNEPAVGGVFLLVSLVALVVVGVVVVRPRTLQVNKIDDAVIELKGVHPTAARVITGS
jgi:hypothetical protein